MRIGIIGFGALGGLYADFFSRDPKSELFFIAGSERLERLRRNPLTVNGRRLSVASEEAGKAEADADILIFAVKHHHLEKAIEDARSHVGASTILFSVMNGIESERTIAKAFGEEHLLYAAALGMDAVREENDIRYSTPGKLLVGRARNEDGTDEDVAAIQNLCDRTGLPWETPKDMLRSLWWKFMINIGINQTSAVLQAPYRTFIASPHARELLIAAMEEVIHIAAAKNIELKREDIDQFVDTILPSMSGDGKTSMCQDVEAGRKTEVEMFSGTLIDMGEEYGIETPINRTLFLLIKAMEHDYLSNNQYQ